MSKLNQFIAEVKGGMAKTQFFTTRLTLPASLNNFEPIRSSMNKIILFCDQAQLPGLSFGTTQVRSYGEFKEVPYEKLFEPVTLSFYVDAEMVVKKLFDEWIGLIQDPKTRDFNYPSTYMTDSIDIIVSDAQDKDRYKVTLNKAYPKSVAPIQLDYAGKEVMKMQVTFTYQYATMTQLASANNGNEDLITSLNAQMPSYNYGYAGLTQIPINYFNDFTGFQSSYQDFTSGKSLTSFENVGEITGFGGIFI
jgi:hypothetical protein